MSTQPPFQGIFAAAVTPLTPDLESDLHALPRLLDFLAERGCDGALMLGTTGEGPSFSVAERVSVLRTAADYRASRPNFRLLAGTGGVNLSDTIELTRRAFDLGYDGVVVLPPFYFKNVSAEGLTAYFAALLHAAVPSDGRVLVYHIPQMTGVGISFETIRALRRQFPQQAWGIKDSQDDRAHTLSLLREFPGWGVFPGSDTLLTEALGAGAVGGITALANVTSPLNQAVWQAHLRGQTVPEAQDKLHQARIAVKGLANPAVLKALLHYRFGFPLWPVRPPLMPLDAEKARWLAETVETGA
jgi:4-hydroxy-tetrahydrodipicolinate synthase